MRGAITVGMSSSKSAAANGTGAESKFPKPRGAEMVEKTMGAVAAAMM